MEKLSFRGATEADLPFLLELRERTMSEHLRRSGVEPSESERSERVLARFECAQVIELSGAPVGLVKIARDGKEWSLISNSDHSGNAGFRPWRQHSEETNGGSYAIALFGDVECAQG